MSPFLFADRKLSGSTICLFVMSSLVAFAPLHTKILGAAWVFFFVWGMRNSFRSHILADQSIRAATLAWLVSCGIALFLAWICIAIWGEDLDGLNPQMRLALMALAAMLLIYKRGPSPSLRSGIAYSLAAGCTVAFFWTTFLATQGMDVRENLASNAIPWAAAISFYPCLLLPLALSENQSIRRRRLWLIAVLLGLTATILSETRGVLLVLPWCLVVYGWFWHQSRHDRLRSYRVVMLSILLAGITLAVSWWAPGDPLRLHKTIHEVREIQSAQNYNTSIGARLYIWNMAIEGISASPWIGIGSSERKRRIENAGENGPPEELGKYATVRGVGHVHNQYLNSALDGGIIGLIALLTLLIGMIAAIRKLIRVDTAAAWQLGGVLLMHATTSITNVNFLHNYYVMALSLAAIVPLLCARRNLLS